MAATTSRVERPVEDAVLANLEKIRELHGCVPNSDVRAAAARLQCSTRRVRRMLARGYVRHGKSPWTPSDDVTTLLVQCKGSIAVLRRELERRGVAPDVSERTMQRGFSSHYDQHLLAGAREGYQAMWATLPANERIIQARNEEWAIDHTLVPVFVRLPDGSWVKPWMTTVLDAATRMVLAVTLTPHSPSMEESVETIALAAEGWTEESGVFVGGQPQALMSDRGGDLVTHAMTTGLISQGTERRFTEAYSAHQNGRIERWHRTIKDEVCSMLVGYDFADRTARDPRKPNKPIEDPAMLMPVEGLYAEILKAVREYNTVRTHAALSNRTPMESWARDETEIVLADPAGIRSAMTQQERRKVHRGTVKFANRSYVMPHGKATVNGVERSWREVLEGKFVSIRYLPTRPEFVEVFSIQTGESVGRATWSKLLDEDEANKHLAHRRKAITTLRASIEDIATANAAAEQARREAARDASPDEDHELDWGPIPEAPKAKTGKTSGRKKAPVTEVQSQRKTVERQRRKESLSALQASVLRSTGTDDSVGF